MKKLSLCLCAALLCAALGGCWDYRGLDQLTIVAGIAVDADTETPGGYAISFEIVDMAGSDKENMQSKIIETKGATMTEAVYNANKQLHNNMFFGNTEILVISEEIARDKGMQPIVDPLLRDNSIRDNLTVLVSREKTAKEIITPSKDSPQIVSYELNSAIGSSDHIAFSANSTRALELDQIYNDLSTEKYQLALPGIRFIDSEKKEMLLDGLILFMWDKAVGYLDDDAMPWYLLAADKLKSGSIDVFLEPEGDAPPQYFSLVIRHSEPKKTYTFDGKTFTFTIHVKVNSAVSELSPGFDKITDPVVMQFEQRANTVLNEQIGTVAEIIRDEYASDCLGFGACVANKDIELWRQVEDDWETWFQNCEIKVESDVFIHDTGLMKEF